MPTIAARRSFGGRPGRRHDIPTVRKRQEEVEDTLRRGTYCMRVESELAAKWNVSTRQIREDVSLIRKRWAKLISLDDTPQIKRDILQQFSSLAAEAREAKQYGVANKILENIVKVLGAYEADRHEHNVTVQTLSTDDLLARVQALAPPPRQIVDVQVVEALPAPLPDRVLDPLPVDAGEGS